MNSKNRIVYHYIIRYSFRDRKKSEIGYGTLEYDTLTKISDSSFNIKSWLEREIAAERNHEIVSISCFGLNKAEILS